MKDTPAGAGAKKSKFADKFASGPSFDDFVGGNEKLSVEEALELKETVVEKEAAEAVAKATGKPAKRAPYVSYLFSLFCRRESEEKGTNNIIVNRSGIIERR